MIMTKTRYCPDCEKKSGKAHKVKLLEGQKTIWFTFYYCPTCAYQIKVYNSYKDFIEH